MLISCDFKTNNSFPRKREIKTSKNIFNFTITNINNIFIPRESLFFRVIISFLMSEIDLLKFQECF